MKKFLTALLTTLLLTTPAQALPVQEAVQTALANNPSLQRTEQSILIAEESLKSARGQKGLSVSASGSVNASKTEGVEESQRASSGLSASIPLYTGGRLESGIKAAELGIKISRLEFAQAQDNLIYNVVKAYVNALENLATSQVDLEHEKNLSEHERMIAAQFEAGAKAKIDLIRAQVETSNALQDAARSHAAYEVALANLSALMSIDSIASLTVEDFDTHLELGDIENYLSEADENRFDLKADALKIEQGEWRVNQAKSGWLPNINANVGTDFNAASKRWHVTPDASAGISASWSIFDSGVTRAEVDSAKVEVEQLKLAMKSDLDTIHEEVVTAHKNLKIALLRLTTTQRAVELAEEERFIATERYNVGEGILLDILDAELALSTAKKNNVSARYDVIRYSFDLSHAVGNTLKALGKA